jgi:hypothetical protein
MIEVLKKALEALELCNGAETVDGVVIYTDQEIAAIKEAIAELESQEPVAWLLTEKNINSLQVDSIQLLINRLKHAHHTDLCVRINGQDEWFQADWLKHMVRATPPQRTEQEPVAVYGYCPECEAKGVMRERRPDGNDKCAKGHTYPSSKATTAPQRTWVGLTDKELDDLHRVLKIRLMGTFEIKDIYRAVEQQLKEKNA